MPYQLASNTNSFRVNTNEFPVNSACIKQDKTRIGVFNIFSNRAIVDYAEWQEYTDNTGAQYANQAAVVTALRGFLFKVLS